MTTDSLSPTAGELSKVLKYEAPLTRQEILAETDRCESAVDAALTTLENRGYVDRTRKPGNLRQTVVDFRGNTDP
jgi:predicted transcriptional regulator